MSHEDRRENERTPVLLKVQYHEPNQLLTDYLTDLAEGGLFLRTHVDFQIGQQIAFDVSFPGAVEPMTLRAVVRWRNVPPQGAPQSTAGVGVEFLFADDAQKAQMAELVARVRLASRPDQLAASIKEQPASEQTFQVLLVEDNAFMHDLFKHAIKRFHHEVPSIGRLSIFSAMDGQDALQFIENQGASLALVDHFLPVMNGSELVARMRQMPRFAHVPIVMVSVGGEGVREAALRAGADLYLDKPVLLKQLLTTLRLLVMQDRSGAARAASP